MAENLNRRLRKDLKPSWLDLSDEQIQEFKALTQVLVEAPLLARLKKEQTISSLQ